MVVAKASHATVIAVALAAGGCDRVLGLSTPVTADAQKLDAGPRPGCTLGHDEDGDGIDDCLDNCPGIANADQADLLEMMNGAMPDGIGDACDPAPTQCCDRLDRFISFVEPNEDLEWNVINGSWTITNDAYLYTGNTSSGGRDITQWAATRPAFPFMIEAGLAFDDVEAVPATQTGRLDVAVDSYQQASCEIDYASIEQLAISSGSNPSMVPLPAPITDGTKLVLRVSISGTPAHGTMHCSIDNGPALTRPFDNLIEPGYVQLVGTYGVSRVTYLAVYDQSGEM